MMKKSLILTLFASICIAPFFSVTAMDSSLEIDTEALAKKHDSEITYTDEKFSSKVDNSLTLNNQEEEEEEEEEETLKDKTETLQHSNPTQTAPIEDISTSDLEKITPANNPRAIRTFLQEALTISLGSMSHGVKYGYNVCRNVCKTLATNKKNVAIVSVAAYIAYDITYNPESSFNVDAVSRQLAAFFSDNFSNSNENPSAE